MLDRRQAVWTGHAELEDLGARRRRRVDVLDAVLHKDVGQRIEDGLAVVAANELPAEAGHFAGRHVALERHGGHARPPEPARQVRRHQLRRLHGLVVGEEASALNPQANRLAVGQACQCPRHEVRLPEGAVG